MLSSRPEKFSLTDLTYRHRGCTVGDMTNPTNFQALAATAIADADFRQAWPIEVRRTLVRAAQTEGDFPAYAVRSTERALRVAAAIEKRLARDIEVGEANLTHAQRKALVRA
jgi:hypothetical protein